MRVAERRRKKNPEQQQNKCQRERRIIKESENLLRKITRDTYAI